MFPEVRTSSLLISSAHAELRAKHPGILEVIELFDAIVFLSGMNAFVELGI